MAPKRNGKDGERASGKRARTSEGKGKGKEPVVSEGITERQLASFSQVSAEAANSSRLLHKNSQSGLNSLLAAAGAHSGSHQHSSNVLGEYKAALHLLHLQQGSMHAFPSGLSPHAIGSAPPTGIPMPLGTVPEMKGLSGDTVRALQLDGTASVPSLRAMLQPGTFDANTMQALLSAQIAAQNSGQTVLQLPHYTLQPGTSALPSMVTLESQHGAGVPYPNTFVAINAINIDTAPDQASKQGSTSSASARPEAKSDVGGAARSHGPSADRYKNRWSEDEIMALKKGVTRFEKKNKKRAEEGSSASSKERGGGSNGSMDASRKGETEQMWEHILTAHKFQACRTARDLKDKWRQLKKKEQDDLLGVREEARRLRMLAVGPGGSSNSSGSQGNANSGDNGSSTSSSNGHGSADQNGNPLEDSPAGPSSPSAGMSSSCSGSTSSPAPTARAAERSGKSRTEDKKAGDMSASPSPANSCAPAPRAPSASKQHGIINGNSTDHGSDNSEASGTGAVGSESGGAEGGSEDSEGGSDERHGAGGSEQGDGSEGGRGQGSEGSGDTGDTGGDSVGNGTDETGQTSMGHSSHSAGTSSHEGRSDSSHEGGSEGRGGEEGASDGSSEWREDDENVSAEKDRKRKHESSRRQDQKQQSSSRSRLPRSSIMDGLDSRDGKQANTWALAVDLGSTSVRVSLVNKHGNTLHGVQGQRSVGMDASAKTFSATEYLTSAYEAIDDALGALQKWNQSQNNACRHSSSSHSQRSSDDSVCSCGNCKSPIVVRVVGISCFAMSLVGVGADGEAVTPVYSYADARNQAYAGELKRKLAEEGSLDFVERRTAPLQSCYAPALFARLRQAGDWGNGKVKGWSSLSALFLSRLTGKAQPMTYSEASWTGLMDREELQWHQGLLNLLGIHHMTLPLLCDADELYKEGMSAAFRTRWPELQKTSWARGIGEAAAFDIGTGCDSGRRRRICVSMSSSAAIRVCVPCKDRRFQGKTHGNGHKGAAHSQEGASRKSSNGTKMGDDNSKKTDLDVPPGLCRYSVKRDVMLIGGGIADGGSIYAWGTEQLAGGLEEMTRMQAEASEMEHDSHGLTVLPFFSGGSSSGSNGGLNPTTGTLTGMTLRTSRADILRAIMESVALRLRGIFLSISSLLPDHSFEVYASGEALFKSPLWQQILVDSLGTRIHFMSGEQDAAGKGAAILALRAIGEDANVLQKPDRVVNPVPAGVSAMTMAFERQEALYNRMNRH